MANRRRKTPISALGPRIPQTVWWRSNEVATLTAIFEDMQGSDFTSRFPFIVAAKRTAQRQRGTP
jgi:hypothetical protein